MILFVSKRLKKPPHPFGLLHDTVIVGRGTDFGVFSSARSLKSSEKYCRVVLNFSFFNRFSLVTHTPKSIYQKERQRPQTLQNELRASFY